MPGDVIDAINGEPLHNLQTLRAFLREQSKGDAVAIQVLRKGQLYFVAFELE